MSANHQAQHGSQQGGFALVRSNDLSQLRDLLIQFVQANALPPLHAETILVQSNGLAQWLRLGFAQAQGCATGLNFSFPSRFIWEAYRAVLGHNHVPSQSSLDRSSLVWRLMRLLPEFLQQPSAEALRHFIGKAQGPAQALNGLRHYWLCCQLADLLDAYQVYRANWLQQWEQGRWPQELQNYKHHQWQTELWRAVIEQAQGDVTALQKFAQPGQDQHSLCLGRADSFAAFKKAVLGQSPHLSRPVGLPARLIVFGIASLPEQQLEVLSLIARWTKVLIFILSPTPHWVERDSSHPLLARWGRQTTDFTHLLLQLEERAHREHQLRPLSLALGENSPRLFEPRPETHTLAKLQNTMLSNSPSLSEKAFAPDDSIEFFTTHSPLRELEVLHDKLLDALQRLPGLQPRDILVMAPNLSQYACHIPAVFGPVFAGDSRALPFFIADASSHETQPLVHAFSWLLKAGAQPINAEELLVFLENNLVMRRFQFSGDDLETLRDWVVQAGIRWGLNAQHRHAYLKALVFNDTPAAAQGAAPLSSPPFADSISWAAGLKRLLLAYSAGNSIYPWQGIAPAMSLDLQPELLNKLLELLQFLDETLQQFQGNASVSRWCDRLTQLSQNLLKTNGPAVQDADRLLNTVEQSLQTWKTEASLAGYTQGIDCRVVQEHWLPELTGERQAQRFFSGGITFASFTPLRSIAFRVVCLLGMADGQFPRPNHQFDIDLMAAVPQAGDRSRRDDDLTLLLEAVGAARDRLLVSWVGRRIQDNSECPPCLPIQQLLDELGHSPTTVEGSLIEVHPLHSHDPSYYEGQATRFTYRPHPSRGLLMALAESASSPAAQLQDNKHDISLAQLQALLTRPGYVFYEYGLKARLKPSDRSLLTEEPIAPESLERWQLKTRLLLQLQTYLQSGLDSQAAIGRAQDWLRACGLLPQGGWAEPFWCDLQPDLIWLADHYMNRAPHAHGAFTASNPLKSSADLVKLWPQHLQRCLTTQGESVVLYSIDGIAELPALAGDQAKLYWAELCHNWQLACQSPLPLTLKTGWAWASAGLTLSEDAGREAIKAKAYKDAAQKYDIGSYNDEEVKEQPFLRWHYPEFKQLEQSQGFARFAQSLYRPIVANLHWTKRERQVV